MKYLFDVNSLIAFALGRHVFHRRVFHWVDSIRASKFFTCSITELGFVRIITQPSGYGLPLDQARNFVLQMKSNSALPLAFLPDDQDIAALPSWVRPSAQTTDGHLAQLATAHGVLLATLDAKIPGAFHIP
jgi:predicted nucleic acid-binding protein